MDLMWAKATNSGLFTRRSFLRKSILAGGSLGILGQIAPNLILNPAYAGSAVIVDSGTDKRVSLSNASFARPFNIGSWSELRVAVRIQMLGSASLTNLNPILFIGLCSGSASQVLDANTTNAFGLRYSAATWTFSTATTPDSYSITQAKAASKVVNTWTDGTAVATNTLLTAEAVVGDPPMIIAHIIKGSPNYTCNIFYPTAATSATTRDEFLTQAVAVTPTQTSHTWDSAGNTVAFDEVAGTLDHVCIGYNRSEATVEITDIAVVKMAA